ncbi:MAG: flagellar hook-basal body complex protein FliE [Motilibacteraceae bacterium]
MSISPISLPIAPVAPLSAAAPAQQAQNVTGTNGADGADFASILAKGVDSLQATQANADTLAVQAATGDLKDVHDYTIAATQAQLATDLAVTLRNKAVDAFNEIMRMQI